MTKIDLCLMCNRPFVTYDEGYQLCCSVGCSSKSEGGVIEVVYKGAVVARVGTPEDAVRLIRSLESPNDPSPAANGLPAYNEENKLNDKDDGTAPSKERENS